MRGAADTRGYTRIGLSAVTAWGKLTYEVLLVSKRLAVVDRSRRRAACTRSLRPAMPPLRTVSRSLGSHVRPAAPYQLESRTS